MPGTLYDRAGIEVTLADEAEEWDLCPWQEAVWSNLATNAPAGAVAQYGEQQSYGMVIRDTPFFLWDYFTEEDGTTKAVNDLSIDQGTFTWWTGQGVSQVQQAQNSLATSTILGAYNDMWRPICSGLNLPEKETVQAQFTLGSQYNSGAGLVGSGLTFWNLRGWRKYRKGSIQPYQLSPEELRAAGFEFWPHVYSSQVTVYFAPSLIPGGKGGGAASQEQLFNCPAAVTPSTEADAGSPHAQQGDFLVQRIAVRPTAPVAPVSPSTTCPDLYPFMNTILVGILPKGGVVAALQGGTNMPPNSYQGASVLGLPQTISMVPWGSMMSVDYSAFIAGLANAPPINFNPVPRLETIWDLVERPLLVKNNTRWNLQAQGAFALGSTNSNGAMVIEFSFHGVILTRRGSRGAGERYQAHWVEQSQKTAQRRREIREGR